MKTLTIITNFEGAHVGVPVTTLSSLDMLKDAIRFEKADTVCIMGGGDPLYEIDKHYKYYGRLFRYCREMDIPVELRTKHVADEFPYARCRKVTYVVDNFDDLIKIKEYGREWVRVEFEVGKSCTLDLIDKVAKYCHACKDINELCFIPENMERGSHLPKNCHEYLQAGHNQRWVYITVPTDKPPYFVNGEIRYRWSDIFE